VGGNPFMNGKDLFLFFCVFCLLNQTWIAFAFQLSVEILFMQQEGTQNIY
jgi:hypothetical protein